MQDDLERRRSAGFAHLGPRLRHAVEDLEKVPVRALVLVDRTLRRRLAVALLDFWLLGCRRGSSSPHASTTSRKHGASSNAASRRGRPVDVETASSGGEPSPIAPAAPTEPAERE